MQPVLSAAIVSVLLFVGGVPWAEAQPSATYKTGAEFYLAYRAAFNRAKSMDELTPWLAKERGDRILKTPADEKKEIFAMIKAFDDYVGIKVVKESTSASGTELQIEAMSASEKSEATAVVKLVKEGGAWRIFGETWKSGTGQ